MVVFHTNCRYLGHDPLSRLSACLLSSPRLTAFLLFYRDLGRLSGSVISILPTGILVVLDFLLDDRYLSIWEGGGGGEGFGSGFEGVGLVGELGADQSRF